MASVRSLDNALEVTAGTKITSDAGITQIPNNGKLIRNLIHGADTVMSHITHFYALAALDFVDASYLGPPASPTYFGSNASSVLKLLPGTYIMHNGNMVVSNYLESLVMRRKAHTMSAIFAGRHPIQNAIVPGGVTTLPTVSDVKKFSNLLDQIRNFINTAYVRDVCTVANAYSAYWTVGTAPGNLLSYGEYPVQNTTGTELLAIRRGVTTLANLSALSFDGASNATGFLGNVREHVGHSYYKSPSQLHPGVGKTEPDLSKIGDGTHYSWLKAPRFGTSNLVCEVGPLSRVLVTRAQILGSGGLDPVVSAASGIGSGFTVNPLAITGTYTLNGLLTTALTLLPGVGATHLVSTLGRHAARALETKFLADAMADTGIGTPQQAWLSHLRAGLNGDTSGTVYSNLTNPVYVYAKLPNKPASGAGWAEAPRGALGHWISIEKKKITNYQCVVPSTWNHSPQDDSGVRGPAEQVVRSISALGPLAGYTMDDIMITLLRLLHQYDFCIACAVHVVKTDGTTALKFKVDTDGSVTKLPLDAEI